MRYWFRQCISSSSSSSSSYCSSGVDGGGGGSSSTAIILLLQRRGLGSSINDVTLEGEGVQTVRLLWRRVT